MASGNSPGQGASFNGPAYSSMMPGGGLGTYDPSSGNFGPMGGGTSGQGFGNQFPGLGGSGPMQGIYGPPGAIGGTDQPGFTNTPFPNGPGDPQSGGMLNYNGTQLSFQNPGLMSTGNLNPQASGYLDSLNGLEKQFSNSAAGGAFNPAFYHQMQQTQQDQLTTSLGNQYAKMGLGGSSAAMGGMSSAIQQNQMGWLNRQQSDQMQALNGLEGLNKMGYGEMMGIQNQYGDFEGAYNQSIANLLGVKAGQDNANTGAIAGIGQGLLMGAGAAAGGGFFGGL